MSESSRPDLGFIQPTRLSGSEEIRSIAGGVAGRVSDFWAWAYSDLLNNLERGVFAEFLVSRALCGAEGVRASWAPYDVRTPEGVRVEVKSGSYIQSWFQKDYTEIYFGVQPTTAWDPHSNKFVGERKRQAEVYVFCLLAEKDQGCVSPLQLDQWEFFVLSTSVLDERLPKRKSLSLKATQSLGAKRCRFEDLPAVVAEVAALEQAE